MTSEDIAIFGITAAIGIVGFISIFFAIKSWIKRVKTRKEERERKEKNDRAYEQLCRQYPSRAKIKVNMAPDKRVIFYSGTMCLGEVMAIRDREDDNGEISRYLTIFPYCNGLYSLSKRRGLDIPINSHIIENLTDEPSGFVSFSINFILCNERHVYSVVEDESYNDTVILSVNRNTGIMTMMAKDGNKIVDSLFVDRCYMREAKEMFMYYLLAGDQCDYLSTGLSNIIRCLSGFGYDYLTIGCGFDPTYVPPVFDYDL